MDREALSQQDRMSVMRRIVLLFCIVLVLQHWCRIVLSVLVARYWCRSIGVGIGVGANGVGCCKC